VNEKQPNPMDSLKNCFGPIFQRLKKALEKQNKFLNHVIHQFLIGPNDDI
jgi:hypothetical protein